MRFEKVELVKNFTSVNRKLFWEANGPATGCKRRLVLQSEKKKIRQIF